MSESHLNRQGGFDDRAKNEQNEPSLCRALAHSLTVCAALSRTLSRSVAGTDFEAASKHTNANRYNGYNIVFYRQLGRGVCECCCHSFAAAGVASFACVST